MMSNLCPFRGNFGVDFWESNKIGIMPNLELLPTANHLNCSVKDRKIRRKMGQLH